MDEVQYPVTFEDAFQKPQFPELSGAQINYTDPGVITFDSKQFPRYFLGTDPVGLDAESGSTTLTVKEFLDEVSSLPASLVEAALSDQDEGITSEGILEAIRSQGLEEAVMIKKKPELTWYSQAQRHAAAVMQKELENMLFNYNDINKEMLINNEVLTTIKK